MSDTANSFGGQAYTSQTTKALTSITESPGPDLSDGEQQFVSMLSRHDYQIKFLADNQQTLQVGVNQATSNPIQQVQQFVADIQVLLSGASLPKGALDFGDLQYILPAIGALFGFGTGEYPVNLFTAAEKFFFGYVVPTQQYTDLQIAGFNSYASQLGIDPKFIKDMDSLTQAFGDLFNGLQNIGPSLASLFDALGISGTDLGPLGQLLAPILKWFQPIDFSKFGSMIEWLTDAIDPWVVSATKAVDWINALIAAFGAGGDVVNSPLPDVTRPFSNLIKLFATLDLTDPQFKTLQGWEQLFTSIFVNLTEFDQGVWAALGGATDIPISAITNSQPNLLYNADFEGAISIAESDDWSWDPTVYYSADAVPGSGKLTADGHGHGLQSNPIRLRAGQKLNLRVRVLTSGLVATGTPLTLDVVLFLNGTQVSVENIASTGAPTGDASDWFSAPSGAKDGLLQGVFTMPDNTTADSIRMRLGVAASATAGDVWFDDTLAALTGGLITNLLDDFNTGSEAFTQLWTSITTAASDYTTWSAFAASFNTAVQTYVTTMSGLEADEVVTIEQLLNSLIPGLFPTGSTQPNGITSFFDQITGFFRTIFGSGSSAGALTSIAAPAVSNTAHSAQVVPNFPNAASLVGVWYNGGGWEWDSAVSLNGSGGSAKCTANGAVQAQNGVVIPVQPGQTVALGPDAQWSGLSAGSGTSPIQAQIVPWSGTTSPGTPGTPVTVAEVTSPGSSEGSWIGLTPVTNSGAGVAAGVYTVPDTGVGFVQARIVVTADASAGSVWWNACDTVISGGFLPTMNDDIARLKSDGEASIAATQTFLQAIQTAITGYTSWSTFIAVLQSAYETWVTTESGLAADEFATVQQMLDSLFGIDSSTGRNTQWSSVMAQITALQTLLASPPVSAAAWAAWWTATLEALGVDSTDATNTANFLSGNYSTALNANSWVTRLLTDATIFLDLLHFTYQPGTSSDAPGTLGTNGKPTWWSAVNDVLALFHVATTVTAPASGGSTPGQIITANTAAVAASATTIQSNADAVNRGITGTTSTGADATAVQTAISGLQGTVAAVNSQVAAIQTATNSPTTVLSDNGQSSPGSGLGTGWDASGSTTAVNRNAISGFTWTRSGTAVRSETGIYTTPLATNDQVATIVFNQLMEYNGFNPTGNPYGLGAPENWILLRVDSPTSPLNWVGVRIRYADVQFGYCASGTIHMLGSPTTFYAGASSSYTLKLGDASSDYNFALVSANRVIASYADTAHATSAILTNRYAGQLWKSDVGNPGGGSTECAPGATSWTAYDASSSVGTPAQFGWVTQTGTGSVTMTSGFLPYTFFDTPVSLGSRIVQPTSGNAGLQVLDAGLYTVSWGLRQPSTSNATDLYPGIAVNGTLQEVGPTFMYDGGGTLLEGGNFGMASAGILLNANDIVSPWQGVQTINSLGLTGAGGSWTGESTGVRSYMKIAKIG